jgi:hypothetical protein
VPLLRRKPGALRDGAPFIAWELPASMNQIRALYRDIKGGDRDFVDLLLMVIEHDIETIEMACALALEDKTTHLPAITNLINQLIETMVDPLPKPEDYPQLKEPPEANCERYQELCPSRVSTCGVTS